MSTPKILGKIDLSGGRSGRSSSSEKKPESPKKPAAAPEISASSAPAADVKPVEPSQPVRQPVVVAEQPAPSPRPEKTVTAPVVVQSQTYDERVAADQSNLFRPEEGARLSGPKVLGKIDVQSFEKKKGEDGHRRREKRKRITKDKVDITQKQNQTATARPDGRPKSQGGGPYSSQGGSQHGPKSGLRDRKKGKSVKPVVQDGDQRRRGTEADQGHVGPADVERLEVQDGQASPRQARGRVGPPERGDGASGTGEERVESDRIRYGQRAGDDDGRRR